MSDASIHTVQLQQWIQRMRAGDREAREELLRSLVDRLERLAKKMLRGFAAVHSKVETADVLQNALMRLLRALEVVEPESMRAFFGLAAAQIRRELLDLARHFKATRTESLPESACDKVPEFSNQPAEELDHWCAFHEEVERLPAEEREVVGLTFYHGWAQAEVAELFQVSERTIRRWWLSAQMKLHKHLRDLDMADPS